MTAYAVEGGREMTVNELIKRLKNYPSEIREKQIQIQAPNGLIMKPEIKTMLKNQHDPLNHTADNIECLIITC